MNSILFLFFSITQHLKPATSESETLGFSLSLCRLCGVFLLLFNEASQLVSLLPDGLRVTSCSLSLSPSEEFGTQ